MQFQPKSSRFVALFTGLVLATAAVNTSPAHAMDKSKKLKYGAIALGVAGAYLLSKGKTVPAAAAAAGGYYVYKKSQNARDNERYGNNQDRYGYNPYDYNSGNNGDVYPDDNYSGYGTQYRGNAALRSQKPARNYDLSPYLR